MPQVPATSTDVTAHLCRDQVSHRVKSITFAVRCELNTFPMNSVLCHDVCEEKEKKKRKEKETFYKFPLDDWISPMELGHAFRRCGPFWVGFTYKPRLCHCAVPRL